MYNERQREAVNEMLLDFAKQKAYGLNWRWDPVRDMTEYTFVNVDGRLEYTKYIYVYWAEIKSLWTTVERAIDEVGRYFALWPKVNPYLPNAVKLPEIKKVIFNAPATIVLWADGTKTVVKATNEEYDPEKGLAMAISKKALGNKREYYHTFLHWLKKYEKEDGDDIVLNIDGSEILEAAAKSIQCLAKTARDVTGTLI